MTSPLIFCDIDSPLGKIRLVASKEGLAGCYFHGQKYFPTAAQSWTEYPRDPQLERAIDALYDYFLDFNHCVQLPDVVKNHLPNTSHPPRGPSPEAMESLTRHIKLAPKGSPFQRQVWQTLRSIPPGVTRSYGEVASMIGRPTAARAVAAAIGRNPLSIFIPCHRVIGKNGSLTGYAGGIERKNALLRWESAAAAL